MLSAIAPYITSLKPTDLIKKRYLVNNRRSDLMRHLVLSLAILLGLLGFAQAGTIDPTVNDSKYIEYGKKHECVVPIQGIYSEEEGKKIGFFGSAVIVRPRIILTAAHVVGEGKDAHITLNDKKIHLLFGLLLKKYDKDKMGPLDIALGYLKEDAVIDFYPELYDKDDEIGKVCSISGYGMTGNHRYGAKVHDGKKRAGSNIVKELFNGMLVCSLQDRPYTSLEFMVANGDSGGGLFIDQKLAGINSCIMTHKGGTLNSDIQDESCHTRISVHKPWLDVIIKELEKMDESGKVEIDEEHFSFL